MTGEVSDRGGADAALRRMMVLDTLVGVFVNAAVFPFLLWLLGLPPPAGPFGAAGGLSDAVKATGFPVALMTFVMTLVLRARFRKAPPSAAALQRIHVLRVLSRPFGDAPSVLPGPVAAIGGVVLRTALFTLAAVIVLAPLRVGACVALGLYPLSRQAFTVLNVVHGAIIGLLFMPPIILAAMADTSRRADKSQRLA